MKKILLTLIGLMCFAGARAASGDLFVYPTAPDSMVMLQDRCDYIVSRFWDRCNFGSAFKYPDKLNAAFGDWVSIMPHASADTVSASIDRLMARFAKKGPETLQLATCAENWLYSDTSSMRAPDVFLPFAKAVVANKKIGKAEKARFAYQAQIIESSTVGRTVPAVPIVYRDGRKGTFDEVQGGSVLMFFNDPDCMDCNLARIRLSADPNTRELIDRGELIVASIYPGDVNDEGWQRAREAAAEEWVCIAMPDADAYFDLSSTPAFYFLNSDHKVLINELDIDYLLGAFRTANNVSKQRAQKKQNGK